MDDWTPSPADVGAEIRSRTTGHNGVELGRFNEETRPTAAQVYPLIDAVVSRVTRRCGGKIADHLQDDARRVAALGVACKVELGYYPEQVSSGRSPYAEMLAEYEKELAELIQAVTNDDGDEETGDISNLPIHSFPCDVLLGRNTDW